MANRVPGPMDKIELDTVVGFEPIGDRDVKAEMLQVWAYRRLETFPELLAALQTIAEGDEHPGHVAYISKKRMVEIARAAIAKAEGKAVSK